jgi:hypothetical protein
MASLDGKYDHWSEQDDRVLSFLQATFNDVPEKQRSGADLLIGGVRIEVKSCNEWNRTRHANGKRRRGRFWLGGYEECDFFLFVLVRGDDIDMKLLPADVVPDLGSIPWPQLFDC